MGENTKPINKELDNSLIGIDENARLTQALLDAKVFQLVHRKKPREIYYIRMFNVGQSENVKKARERFAELAKKAKGLKFDEVHSLPPAAVMVKYGMLGEEFGKTEKKKKWEEVLEVYLELFGEKI
jgi:galactose-1-phosphate uridylyltransferase